MDLVPYTQFVKTLTSKESSEFDSYIASLQSLNAAGCDIARLDTAATGLTAESGEILEVIKKIKFQGKPWNEETKFHLKREAGDVMFYLMNLLMALDLPMEDVIQENINKLESRYPGGKFDVHYSENRKVGDL